MAGFDAAWLQSEDCTEEMWDQITEIVALMRSFGMIPNILTYQEGQTRLALYGAKTKKAK